MKQCSICENNAEPHFDLCLEHIAEMAELEIELKLNEGEENGRAKNTSWNG